MEKTKRKRKQWFTRSLDFIAPHELSKSVALFERVSGYEGYDNRLERSHYSLSIELVPVDDDAYRFHAEWQLGDEWRVFLPYRFVKANGYLKRWDRKSTHVFGKVKLPITYCVLLTIVCTAFAIMGLLLFISDHNIAGLLAVPLGLITVIPQWRALNDLQQKLADIIVTAVHPMPESVGYRRINLKLGQPRRRYRS